MLSRERRENILRIVNRNRFVSTVDIAALCSASEATVRRDLGEMEKEGLIRRIHGGAESVESRQQKGGIDEEPLHARSRISEEKKRVVARKAVSLCSPGSTVMIGGGSTTLYMADYIGELKLTVITNSFVLAAKLEPLPNIDLFITGGAVYRESGIILDPFRGEYISNFTAQAVFLSPEGINENGFSNTDVRVIETERRMIARSKECIIIADSSKFGRSGHLSLCNFDSVHALVTDNGIAENWAGMLGSNDVRLITA